MPVGAKKLAILKQARPSPEDESLERAVAAELELRGFQLVAQNESELTLACHAEDNALHASRNDPPCPLDYYQMQRPVILPASGGYIEPPGISSQYFVPTTQTEHAVIVRGIRLQVYPTRSLQTGRFETAWEGYIQAGLKLRPEQQHALIRTLLDHFGRDFAGKVKLYPPP
jgi:hypothetical protein